MTARMFRAFIQIWKTPNKRAADLLKHGSLAKSLSVTSSDKEGNANGVGKAQETDGSFSEPNDLVISRN